MEAITVSSSKFKYALLLVIALSFVVGGALIIVRGEPGDVWLGWACVVFFGTGIPIFSWQLLDSRPRLVLDDQGVLDRTLGVGVIPWTEITGAELKSIQGNHFVCLQLRNPDRWLGQLSPLQRAMVSANERLGFSALNLNLGAINADPLVVYELILKRAAAAQLIDD